MRFCPFPPATHPCVPISFQKRLKSLLVSSISFLCLSEISEKRRSMLRRMHIDQTLYNVVQWNCELQTPLPAMTRCQITIRTSLSAFKKIDFFFSKKRELLTVKGCGRRKGKCREIKWWRKREKEKREWVKEVSDKMRRWEVIASIMEKRGEMRGEEDEEARY